MAVLTVIGVVVALLALAIAIFYFNEHCNSKFSYKFFTKASFIAAAVATWAIIAGYSWYASSVKSGGDILNGIVIVALGVLIGLCLVYFNFKRTNIAYGLCGSALQLSLFIPLAYVGAFFVLLGLVASIFIFANTTPVYVVNK